MSSPKLRRTVAILLALAFIVAIPLAGANAATRSLPRTVEGLHGQFHALEHAQKLTPAQAKALMGRPSQKVIVLLKNQFRSMAGPAHQMLGLRKSAIAGNQSSVLNELQQAHSLNIHPYSIINAVSATVSRSEMRYLQSRPDVRAVVPDKKIQLAPVPHPALPVRKASKTSTNSTCSNKGTLLEPQALQLTNDAFADHDRPQAQNIATGKGVTVAFMADGMDPNNPDFIRKNGSHVFTNYLDFSGSGTFTPTAGGEAFGDASSIGAQGREVYNLGNYVNTASPTYPAAVCTNIRILGMAPGANLISLVVFGTNGSFTSGFVQAIQWATTHGVNVLNQSFGSNPYPDESTDPISLADEAAVADGLTVTVSSGDAGINATNGSPSTVPGVIASGATTQYRLYSQVNGQGFDLSNGKYLNNNISAFSSSGIAQSGKKAVDVVAPGDLGWALCDANPTLYADCFNDQGTPSNIEEFGGTSESAPLTAGEAALVIQAYRDHHHGATPSPAVVKQIIMSTATDLHLPSSEQGAGLINALKAVRLASSYGSHDGNHHQLAINDNACTTAANNVCNLALNTSGTPGSQKSLGFQISNYSNKRQHVDPDGRILNSTPIASGSTTVNMTPATDPTFINETGAMRAYQKTTFHVPGGASVLNVSLGFDVNAFPGSIMYLILLTPNGTYANYSIPQGFGNGFTHAQVHDPAAGTWTAILATRVSGSTSYAGSANLSWSANKLVDFGKVMPSSANIAPGHTQSFSFSFHMPNAGDTSADVLVQAHDTRTTIPVALRSVIPITSGHGTFSGTFTGGNARPGAGNEQTFTFDVPSGLRDIEANIAMPDATNINLEGVLLAPDGRPVNTQSNVTDFSKPTGAPSQTLQFFRTNPEPGRWTLVVLINYYSGPLTSEAYTGTVSFNGVNVTSSGVPNSTSTTITSGTTSTATISVTNTGIEPEIYFVDPRSSNLAAYELLGGSATSIAASGPFFVPPLTSDLVGEAQGEGGIPVNLEMFDEQGTPPVGFLGTPDLFSSQDGGSAAVVNYTAPEVPFGEWAAIVDDINGPYTTTPASPEKLDLVVAALMKDFDLSTTTDTGDLWADFLGLANQPFTPLVLNPGSSGVIHVTFAPTQAKGTVVSGTLNVDTVQVSADGFLTTNFSGDEVISIPYTYTVG